MDTLSREDYESMIDDADMALVSDLSKWIGERKVRESTLISSIAMFLAHVVANVKGDDTFTEGDRCEMMTAYCDYAHLTMHRFYALQRGKEDPLLVSDRQHDAEQDTPDLQQFIDSLSSLLNRNKSKH